MGLPGQRDYLCVGGHELRPAGRAAAGPAAAVELRLLGPVQAAGPLRDTAVRVLTSRHRVGRSTVLDRRLGADRDCAEGGADGTQIVLFGVHGDCGSGLPGLACTGPDSACCSDRLRAVVWLW